MNFNKTENKNNNIASDSTDKLDEVRQGIREMLWDIDKNIDRVYYVNHDTQEIISSNSMSLSHESLKETFTGEDLFYKSIQLYKNLSMFIEFNNDTRAELINIGDLDAFKELYVDGDEKQLARAYVFGRYPIKMTNIHHKKYEPRDSSKDEPFMWKFDEKTKDTIKETVDSAKKVFDKFEEDFLNEDQKENVDKVVNKGKELLKKVKSFWKKGVSKVIEYSEVAVEIIETAGKAISAIKSFALPFMNQLV